MCMYDTVLPVGGGDSFFGTCSSIGCSGADGLSVRGAAFIDVFAAGS